MFNRAKAYLAKRLQHQLIRTALNEIYGEEFDFDVLIAKLARQRGEIHLIRAYLAIETASRITQPLTASDVAQASRIVAEIEAKARASDFSEIVDTRMQMAELYLMMKHLQILRGKLAYKEDEYSYEGGMYRLAFERRGPVDLATQVKLHDISQKVAEASRKVEEAELAAWKKQDPQEYARQLQEREAKALQQLIDEQEDERTDQGNLEALEMLDEKYRRLMA